MDRELNYFPRYDNFDYRKRYEDDYIPRTPSSFYMYPSGAYDLPEPRDVYPYTNEIDRMSPPPPIPPYQTGYQSSTNNRRIIYYATLPEVVRSPPNVDLRYRSHYTDRYDPLYQSNYYNDRYRSNRLPRYYPQSPSTSSSTSTLTEIKDPIKSAPVRISSNLKIKDSSRNAPMEPRHFSESSSGGSGSLSSSNNLKVTNNNINNNQNNGRQVSDHSHSSFQDGVDERDQTYFTRNH